MDRCSPYGEGGVLKIEEKGFPDDFLGLFRSHMR